MGAWGAGDRAGDKPVYIVAGGSAGLLVQYEDLVRIAGRMDLAVERLHGLREQAAELWEEPGIGTGVPADRIRVHLAGAVGGLALCAAALDRLVDGVRESARQYAETEGRIQLRLPSLGPIPLAPWIIPGERAGGFPTLPQTESAMASPADERAMGMAMWWVRKMGFGKPRPVKVTALPDKPEVVHVEGTARSILSRSDVLKRENREGVVEILRIEEAGKNIFVVTIPGTQNGANGSNPFGFTGNGEARLEESRYVAAGVAEALRQAEAEAGDSVILSGYSQGGDHATNVAAELARDSGYDVDFLLTAGSPTGATDLPPGLPALHLEHVQDWVPGIDSIANPDTADRVTLTRLDPVTTPAGEDPGLGPGHRLDHYQQAAAMADASDDASLRTVLGSLGAAIGTATVATRHLYRFSREPLAQAPSLRSTGPSMPAAQAAPPLPAAPGFQRGAVAGATDGRLLLPPASAAVAGDAVQNHGHETDDHRADNGRPKE